jgi:hypothetical protein
MINAELCECGRLYKMYKDETGKLICPACYHNISKDDLHDLWSRPVPKFVLDIFKPK